MSELFSLEPFNLPPAYEEAAKRIIRMIRTGVAVNPDHLPEGPGSSHGIERYARAVCEANPRADLGIIYSLAGVGVCVAVQGGIVLRCPIAKGSWLEVPAIQHFIGIAPSGWRKSTALDIVKGPLNDALREAARYRREELLNQMRTALQRAELENRENEEAVIDPDQFEEIFSAGYCPATVVRDPTTEFIRNMILRNGGTGAVLAAEADVFRNIGAYSNDGGSLTMFLDLWDASGEISTGRVGAGMMEISEACLQMGVLLQTEVFTKVTSGSPSSSGTGADSFTERGVFGRTTVVETTQTGGFTETAAEYSDETVWEHAGPDGMALPGGELTPLGEATADYAEVLRNLAMQTSKYRMRKAIAAAWNDHYNRLGTRLHVPEVTPHPRHAITLTKGPAMVAYNRVQRMYNALEAELEWLDEDAKIVFGPIISRFVQHVMREALVMSLAAGKDEIVPEFIEDAAVRVTPWKMAMTTAALLRRSIERASDIISMAPSYNPTTADITNTGRVHELLAKMWLKQNMKGADPAQEEGWTAREITRALSSTLKPDARKASGLSSAVQIALAELTGDPTSGVTVAEGRPENKRRQADRYRITEPAARAVLAL